MNSMENDQSVRHDSRQLLKSSACAFACLLLGWFAFVRGHNVPFLSGVDLGFHELGHLLTRWLPEVLMLMAGSITQVLVPVGLATYFLWKRRDLAAGGLCLAWAGTSAQNASVYIGDAPYQRLQLIGGLHDWATVLGPEHFNILGSARVISIAVLGAALGLFIAGLSLCCAGLFVDRRRRRAEEQPETHSAAVEDAAAQGWAVVPPWEGRVEGELFEPRGGRPRPSR
jgi:hypothetical protein